MGTICWRSVSQALNHLPKPYTTLLCVRWGTTTSKCGGMKAKYAKKRCNSGNAKLLQSVHGNNDALSPARGFLRTQGARRREGQAAHPHSNGDTLRKLTR